MKKVLLVFLLSLQLTLSAQPDLFSSEIVITNEAIFASSVYATDLDEDGDQDVLSASYLDNKVAWYENDGNGNFGEQNIISTLANGALAVIATDLDGDGDQDVISASVDYKVAWYENDGNGSFGPQNLISFQADGARSVYAADLDGDGDQDVLSASHYADKIAWCENEGGGNFGYQNSISIQVDGARSVHATDLDGDGDQDVLSASRNDDKIAWYENDGYGNFDGQNIISLQANGALSVFASDLDGDGDQDVLSASFIDDKIAWHENQGNGNFGGQNSISIQADGAYAVYTSDLDGDGDQDVLSASELDGKIAWYENDGIGNFIGQNIISIETNGSKSIFAADLDGDGDQDVLSASIENDKIAWYRNMQWAESKFTIDKCIINSVDFQIVNHSDFMDLATTSFQWIFNDDVIATTKDLENYNFPAGTHDLKLIACTPASCDTITKQIDVLQFDLDTVPVLHTNEPYTFTNVSNHIGYWVWEFDDGGIAEVQTPTHTYTEPGVYELEVNIYNTDIATNCFYQLEYMVTVVDSSTTGLAGLQPNSLIVHPNPADEYLYVSNNDNASEAVFVLYNLLGQVLITKEIEGEAEVVVPVGDLVDGIYFCKMSSSEVVHKIVIAH